MNSEGLQRWIDAQVQALNPDSFMAQLALFLAVICVSLLAAAAARQIARMFPLERHGGTKREAVVRPVPAPQMADARPAPAVSGLVALRSTAAPDTDKMVLTTFCDLSSRQKKKFIKAKPKKFYANLEKAPSDPMFLPPFDANVPYRDRLAMIGSNKGVQT